VLIELGSHSSSEDAGVLDQAKLSSRRERPKIGRRIEEQVFRVTIADRDSMTGDLLATVLHQDDKYEATAVRPSDLMRSLTSKRADLVVIASDFNQRSQNGFELAYAIGRTYPETLLVILLNRVTREDIVRAFRSGARGVFCRDRPMKEFLECVESIRKGFIWVKGQEVRYLLDAFRSIPAPSVATANEDCALTARELQTVQFAAKGMTNKLIACELGLSEHTIKNYMSRAFEKLGVSSRIELLFYLTQRQHMFGATPEEDDLSAEKKA